MSSINFSQLELASLECLVQLAADYCIDDARLETGLALIKRMRQVHDAQQQPSKAPRAVEENLTQAYYKDLKRFQLLQSLTLSPGFNATKGAHLLHRCDELRASLKARAESLHAIGVVV